MAQLHDGSNSVIENISESTEAEFQLGTYTERLDYYQQHPLNLNRASYDDFLDLGLLSKQQAYQLLHYKIQHGRILSIYELQAVPTFTQELIQQIVPFVTVDSVDARKELTLSNLSKYGKHDWFVRYIQKWDKEENNYFGNTARYYSRYRYTFYNNFSLGITAEKDPGEAFFKNPQTQGFDFYSYHLYYKGNGKLKAVTVGDYHLNIGQGLLAWTGFGYGKSAFVLDVERSSLILQPYTSVDENRFMRGVGATYQVGRFYITSFFSKKSMDANVIDSSGGEVSSIQTSGLHRTENEWEDRNSLEQLVAGNHIYFQKNSFHFGASILYTKLGATLRRQQQLYNQYRFQGDEFMGSSLDYSFSHKIFHFSGELVFDDKGSIATIHSINAELDRNVSMVLSKRYYDREYESLLSNGFAESSSINNESGMYLGNVIRLGRKWKINSYIDLYKHSWLKFRVDGPSSGNDFFTQLDYRARYGVDAYLRYKREEKQLNSSLETPIHQLTSSKKQSLRLHVRYPISRQVTLQSRLETNWHKIDESTSEGFFMYQDMQWNHPTQKMNFTARITFFDIEDFNNRIYAYENDLLYVFNVPGYSGSGFKYYLNWNYQWSKTVGIWFKVSRTTVITDSDQWESIPELKMQARFRF